MTEEQIKQTSKITEFARNMVKLSNYPKELQDHIIATCMVVVIEATKDLQEKFDKRLKRHCDTIRSLVDELERRQNAEKELQKENTILEKENAELKARVEKQDTDILFLKHLTETQRLQVEASAGLTPWKEIKDKSELIGKLTNAKDIIREYSKWECEYCDYKRNPDYVTAHCYQCQKYPLHKKAEQFLKECK